MAISRYITYIPTFVKVVEKQSFSGAARELGMTKSAVSKHVQALEDGLNARLLNRTTRKLSLTEEGEIFYENCLQVVEELENAERLVHNLNENPSGVLKINAPESLGEYNLAAMLAKFAAKYPEMRLEVEFDNKFIDIIESGVDVVIRVAMLTDSSLIAKKLAPCHFVTAASPDYLKKYGEPKHPDELINHRVIEYSNLPRANEWQYVDLRTGKDGVAPTNVGLRAANANMMRHAAAEGVGIMRASTFILCDFIKEGKLIPILPDFPPPQERNVYALFPHNRYMSTKVRLLIDYIAQEFADVSLDFKCQQQKNTA